MFTVSVAIPKGMKPVAEGSLTVSSTSIPLPAQDVDKAKGEIFVIMGIETDQIRVSILGNATSTSMLYNVDDKLSAFGGAVVSQLRFIRVTADSVIRYWIFGNAN